MELVRARACSARPDVELIGANAEAIATAEDREQFKEAMIEIGLDGARVGHRPHARRGAARSSSEIGLPVIIRPAYILGGRGTGIAVDRRRVRADRRRTASPPARSARSSSSESIAGWKEFELEVMRDRADNCVSSARSRTSTRWACTPATRSRSPRRRR